MPNMEQKDWSDFAEGGADKRSATMKTDYLKTDYDRGFDAGTRKGLRELEIVTASLTDQETENERLREQLAEARAEIERKLVETNWGSIAKKLWPEYGPLGIKGRADRTREMVRETLATPAPSTGESERLKALGNAEQVAADRAANTTDPREAAVASRIANDIKQLRE